VTVRFSPFPPTFGIVMNTQKFFESWNLSSMSVHSSSPISGYMWKLSTWSAKYMVSHCYKWQIWSCRRKKMINICGGGAPKRACSFCSSVQRRAWLDGLSCSGSSANNISVRAEWLLQCQLAPSELSESPRWQTTPRPAPIRCVMLHIALLSQFRRVLSLSRYPVVNEHCGVVANCDHTSGSFHWVHQQNVNRSGSSTQGSISTRHFVYHIRLCYSPMIRYLIL